MLLDIKTISFFLKKNTPQGNFQHDTVEDLVNLAAATNANQTAVQEMATANSVLTQQPATMTAPPKLSYV